MEFPLILDQMEGFRSSINGSMLLLRSLSSVKYARYQTSSISPYTGNPYGPFIAVWHLIRDKKVSADEEAAYWKHRRWFEEYLPIPPFHGQGNPQRAVTWFKQAALTPLMLEKLSFYLDLGAKYGFEFQIITAEHLSQIIYEDEYQVAVVASF